MPITISGSLLDDRPHPTVKRREFCHAKNNRQKAIFCRKVGLNIHRVSKNCACSAIFLNNSVKHWPMLIIFGVQHHEET